MYFSRFLSAAILGLSFSVASLHAQTTNILNLCTEAALRAALEIGGNYRVECGTNAAVAINLTTPLIVRRDINLVATNEILLNGQNLTRLMVVEPGVRVTLSGILFFSGRQTETNLNNGGIADTAGAGIYNNGGIVTILRGRFAANSVLGIAGAAGEDGTDENGEPGGDAAGAAIYNNGGQILVSNVVFEANTTTGGAGGRGGNGRTSGLGDDGGNGGEGGSAAGSAIYSNGGRVTVVASVFTNNTAIGAVAGLAGIAGGSFGFPGENGEAGDGVGAAIAASNADVTIYACTFITNSVRGANGLSATNAVGHKEGQDGRNGGDGVGGAIYSTGSLSVTNSTFFGNIAVSGTGGAGGAGGPDGFGNDGGNGGNGGFATGGAIDTVGPTVIVNCTFSDNAVTPGLGGAGGVGPGTGEDGDPGVTGPARGGAIYAENSQVILANSILANSTITVEGNVSDRGGNISTDLNPLINNFASFRLTNPFLLPLASNGGPTPTMAITTNSPGLDRGIEQFCPDIDQRGTNRTGICDIGAYEITIPLPAIPTNAFSSNEFRIFNRSNEISIRWTAGYTNLYLQQTTNLLSTNTVWTSLTDFSHVRVSSNYYILNITPDRTLPRAFFRLFGDVARTNTSTFPFPQPPGLPGLP